MENGEKIKMIKNIARLNAEVENIKQQVTNHLPKAIKDLRTEMTDNNTTMNKRFSRLEIRIASWGGGIAVALAVLQFILNK
jgi:hypothetical protein